MTLILAPDEIVQRLHRLEQAPSTLWLSGGVAVDFLIGRWTRPHKDLDIVALSPDKGSLESELKSLGLDLVNDGPWTTRWTLDDRRTGEVEIVFVEPAGLNTGILVIPPGDSGGARPGRYAFIENYLDPFNFHELDGVRFRVCSADGEWLNRVTGADLVPSRQATPAIEHDLQILAELVPQSRREQMMNDLNSA